MSGSRKNTAGRPDMLLVNSMLCASSLAISGSTLSTPTQKWRSLPPWLGLPSMGSGLGSSMRWIISGPIHSQAPL